MYAYVFAPSLLLHWLAVVRSASVRLVGVFPG